MKKAISSRLTIMFAIVMAITLTLVGVFLRCSLFTSLEGLMHNELSFRSTLFSPYISKYGTAENWKTIEHKLQVLINDAGGKVTYIIVSPDRKYNFGENLAANLGYVNIPEGFSILRKETESYPIYILTETIKPLGARPEVKFIVTISSKPYCETLSQFTHSLIIICTLGLLLIVLLGYFISRIGLQPARKLSAQANKLSPGDSGQRLGTDTLPAELHTLACAFNGALERQEIAWKQLESFNANVAHELRTPLTNMTGQTQLGLSRNRSPLELKELLESNLEELDRMTSIVNDMLFLSHAQSGERAADLSRVSLRDETQKTYDYLEFSFQEYDLSIQIVGDVETVLDRRLFHRAVANLVENAIRYSSPKSVIRISLFSRGLFAHTEVTNDGVSISDQHLIRLFERFYRVDESRNQSSQHHGLGLAIVKAVAQMHGGIVYARSEQGQNTFGFTVRLHQTPQGQ